MNGNLRRFSLALAVGLAATAGARADDRGRASGVFLRLGRTAREAALGGTGTGASGPSAIVRNPAAIGNAEGAVFGHNEAAGGALAVDTAAVARRVRGRAFGLSLVHASAGSVSQTDDVGESVGTFTPRDMAATLGGSFSFGSIDAGVSATYVYSRIVHLAHALTAGAGLEWRAAERTRVGLYGNNLAGRLTYVDESAPMPRSFRLGVRQEVSRFGFVLEGVAPNDDDAFAAAGVEATFGREPWRFALRAGFDGARSRSNGGANGITAGAGLLAAGWSLDYAFVGGGDVGDDHLVTLGLRFKPSAASAPKESNPPQER